MICMHFFQKYNHEIFQLIHEVYSIQRRFEKYILLYRKIIFLLIQKIKKNLRIHLLRVWQHLLVINIQIILMILKQKSLLIHSMVILRE